MASYSFRYQNGQSAPYHTLEAENDGRLFGTVLPAWERQTGFSHIKDTVVHTGIERRKVADPVPYDKAAKAHPTLVSLGTLPPHLQEAVRDSAPHEYNDHMR